MTAHARALVRSSDRNDALDEPAVLSGWTIGILHAARPPERLSTRPLPNGLPSAHAYDFLAVKMLKHVFNPGEGWHAALPGGLAAWSQDWHALRIAGVLGAKVPEAQTHAVIDCWRAVSAIVARRIEDWRWAAYAAVLQAQDAGGARVKRANDKRNTVYVGDNGVIVVLTLGQVQRLVTCWREPRLAGTRSSPRDVDEARRYRTSSRPRIADLMKPKPFAGLRGLVPDEELSPEPSPTDDTQDPGENL